MPEIMTFRPRRAKYMSSRRRPTSSDAPGPADPAPQARDLPLSSRPAWCRDARDRDVVRHAEPPRIPTRVRGSITRYAMSTRKLAIRTPTITNRKIPCSRK